MAQQPFFGGLAKLLGERVHNQPRGVAGPMTYLHYRGGRQAGSAPGATCPQSQWLGCQECGGHNLLQKVLRIASVPLGHHDNFNAMICVPHCLAESAINDD